MREELRERLKTSFTAARGLGSPGAASSDDLAADPFVDAFLGKAERVVAPAMREIGRALEAQGRFFSIETIRERRSGRGLLVPTSVQMNFFRRPKTVNYKNACPHFRVVCDRSARQVLFQRSRGASATSPETEACGSCALDQLTRDLVQERIIAALDALWRA